MAIYKGGDLENLVRLINESNPQLPWELDVENFIYGPPQDIPGVGDKEHNTRIRVQAKMSSPYRGSVDLTYRRKRLSTLFRGIKVEIHRWWTGTSYMNQILPLINEQFGLNLHNDFGNGPGWTVSASGQARVLQLNEKNYEYTGSVNIWMYMDKEELGLDVLKVQDIDAVRWPGGDDFTVDRRGQMQFMFTAGDFTEALRIDSSNLQNMADFGWKNINIINLMRSLNSDLTLESIDPQHMNVGSRCMLQSSNNNTVINDQNDITNVRNMMRSKAMLDRELPFLDHGFNRIGVYRPDSLGNGMTIIYGRDPETNVATDFTPLTGEAVLKWNMLW